eukprot:scaffold11.g4010.t1
MAKVGFASLAIVLLAGVAGCRASLELRLEPDAALREGVQVESLVANLQPHGARLDNLGLSGTVAAVRFLPGCLDAAQAAEPSQSQAVALDFHQTWDLGLQSFSIEAQWAPQELPWADIQQVAVYCQSCTGTAGKAGHAFSGILASAATGQSRSLARGGALVFVLRGAALARRQQQQQQQQQQLGSAAQASSRRLAQASGGCSLTVAGQTSSYQGCTAVKAGTSVTDPAGVYQVWWTIEPAASGGGSTWKGGIKVDTNKLGNQWAGFGFPKEPATMIGTKAVIAQACADCPSGATLGGYVLKSYDVADQVNGSFPIRDASAALTSDGFLVARFTADLDQSPSTLSSNSAFDINYAVGLLAADGKTRKAHTIGGPFPYGGTTLDLAGGISGVAPSPEGASAAAAPAPAAAASTSPAAPAAPQTEGANTAGAGAAGISSSGDASAGCQLTVGGKQQTFSACTTITEVGGSLSVMWSAAPLKDSPSRSLLSVGMSAATDGWVAVGFPQTPATMIGSTALILKAASSLLSGADINQHFLPDKTTNHPPGHLPVTNLQASATGGSGSGRRLVQGPKQLTGTFQIELDTAAVNLPSFPLIFAGGRLASDGTPLQHGAYAATSVDLASGAASAASTHNATVDNLRKAHAWLMAFAFGLFFPLGVLTARGFKDRGPFWFTIHRGVLAAACSLSAFTMIFVAVNKAGSFSSPNTPTHRKGLTKVQLIISNSDWAVAVVSVVFGLIVLTGVAKDLLDYARLTPAARSSAVPFVRHTYPTPPQAHAARKDSEQESGGSSQGGGSSSKAQD